MTAASGESSVYIISDDQIESIPNGKTDVERPFLEIPDAVFPTETFVRSVDSYFTYLVRTYTITAELHTSVKRSSVLLLYVYPTSRFDTAKNLTEEHFILR